MSGDIREVQDGSGKVRERSGYPPGGSGRVGGPSVRIVTVRRTRVEVREWSEDPREVPGRVGGTLREVRYGSGDLRGGPGRVGGPSGRPRTGRGTLWEVLDASKDTRGGPEQDGGHSGRSGTGWERYGRGRGTLAKDQDGLGDTRRGPGQVGGTLGMCGRGWGDPRGSLGRVVGPSGRSGTGQGTLGESRDGLGDF